MPGSDLFPEIQVCVCAQFSLKLGCMQNREILYISRLNNIFIHDCLWTLLLVLIALWVFCCAWYSNLAGSRSESSNYFEDWQNPWQRLTNASCSPHLSARLCRSEPLARPQALVMKSKAVSSRTRGEHNSLKCIGNRIFSDQKGCCKKLLRSEALTSSLGYG